MKYLKKKFNRYLFEIIVIFLGITISFVFEGWRQGKEDARKVREELALLSDDLARTTDWIIEIDSQYTDLISMISAFSEGEALDEEDLSYIFWGLDFYPINFPVRELSPYLDQVSELSTSDEISNSQEIISLITYIKTLSRVDFEENQLITSYTTSRLWPKLSQHDLYQKVLEHERDWSDDDGHWSDTRYTKDMMPDIGQDLAYIEMKLRRILTVHVALKHNMLKLTSELEKI